MHKGLEATVFKITKNIIDKGGNILINYTNIMYNYKNNRKSLKGLF